MLGWFERHLDPYPKAAPTQPPKTLVAFCLHYMQGAKRWMVITAVTAGAIAAVEITLFGFLGRIVDWLTSVDRETFFATQGPTLWFMAICILIILPVLVTLNTLVIHQTILGNLPQRIRWQTHRYLMRQSLSYFQDEFAGRIATKLMQTALAVRDVALDLLNMLVYALVSFLGAVALAASGDWRLAIPISIWVVVYGALMIHFVPRIGEKSERQADARSLMTGRIVDSYTNISTVKLFSHSAREERYARAAMDEFLVTVYGQMRQFSGLTIAIHIINMALLFSSGALSLWLWQRGDISSGAVAIALALALHINSLAQWIMWEMSELFENIGTVRDGIGSFSLPRMVPDAVNATPLNHVKGDICFNNVNFSYGKNIDDEITPNAAIISNLNIAIRPGEKIGLVGHSGAGKSTIVNLLLRFYDLSAGQITIDGQDIAHIKQESLRANIGVVTQDTSLLHRSVRENILYGRPDAGEEEMIAAARLAEAHEFILELEDAKGRKGYDAHVGERGVKLSGGQRQRVAIARVLLKNAPILILDEATSALDSEIEAAIQEQLQRLMHDKTVVAIAHRLSTIAAMDRLIVLDRGRIIEQGTHAELLVQNGPYAKLWARQSGGFLTPDQLETTD